MQGAASHDYAKQRHLTHQLGPSQQQLPLVAPTIHQAAERHIAVQKIKKGKSKAELSRI